MNLGSPLSLSIPTEHASKAQKRKREVACLHAISPDVSIGKEGPCKLPVRNRPADRVHKSVHAAYYSHVRRIRSRAGKLAVSFASPFSLSSIRRDRSVFSPLSFSLPSSSRRLWRSTDRESLLTFTGREEGRGGLEDRSADIYLSEKESFVARRQLLGRGEGQLLGRVSKLSGFALIDSFLEVWQKRRDREQVDKSSGLLVSVDEPVSSFFSLSLCRRSDRTKKNITPIFFLPLFPMIDSYNRSSCV